MAISMATVNLSVAITQATAVDKQTILVSIAVQLTVIFTVTANKLAAIRRIT